MSDLIDELEYVLDVEYQYNPAEKYTNPMLFPISAYKVTACKFRVHFLELVKY